MIFKQAAGCLMYFIMWCVPVSCPVIWLHFLLISALSCFHFLFNPMEASSSLKASSSTLESPSLFSLSFPTCTHLGWSSGQKSSSRCISTFQTLILIDAIAPPCAPAQRLSPEGNTQSHTAWHYSKFKVCRWTWVLSGFCPSLSCACQLTSHSWRVFQNSIILSGPFLFHWWTCPYFPEKAESLRLALFQFCFLLILPYKSKTGTLTVLRQKVSSLLSQREGGTSPFSPQNTLKHNAGLTVSVHWHLLG